MLKGGLTISLDIASLLKSLPDIELDDLRNKLIYAGYAASEDNAELMSSILLFIDDKNLTSITNKEGLWLELINHGYKLGDRILNLSDPELRGSDVEELQELLSRLGFYSEPINGIFNIDLVSSVTAFQENRGLSIDGNVGLGTVNEIRMLMRPNLNTSLNEAIKSISPNLSTSVIGHSVCFDIPNEQDYAAQIDTYEITKSVCLENNIIASFASEVGKTTKEENIIKQKANEVIEFLNLGHLRNELAGNLSGGQKKLLELGRTMMVDAKLVLLDEVGAGVNRTLLKDLGTAIEKLNKEKGYTFCMIEHDMDFIGRLCDPVIVMAEGSVLFEGSVEDAKKDEKVIESYLGRGSKIKDN